MSTVLPVSFVIRDDYLAVLDHPTGKPASPLAGAYLRLHEQEAARQQAEAAHERAKAEIQRLRALLEQQGNQH